MPTLRICSFNCEFMNDWFTPDAAAPTFRPTFTRDGHTSNTQQTAGRTAALIKALDELADPARRRSYAEFRMRMRRMTVIPGTASACRRFHTSSSSRRSPDARPPWQRL